MDLPTMVVLDRTYKLISSPIIIIRLVSVENFFIENCEEVWKTEASCINKKLLEKN